MLYVLYIGAKTHLIDKSYEGRGPVVPSVIGTVRVIAFSNIDTYL